MNNPALQIALGSVSIALEEASSLEDVKSVVGDLISALDENLCASNEEESEAKDE